MQDIPPEVLAALRSVYSGMDKYASQANAKEMRELYMPKPPGAPGEEMQEEPGPAPEAEQVPGAEGADMLKADAMPEEGEEELELSPELIASLFGEEG